MKKCFLGSLLMLLTCELAAQTIYRKLNSGTNILIEQADSLYKERDYLEAARKYQLAIASENNQLYIDVKYRCAAGWSLGKMYDSALIILTDISRSYDDYPKITKDKCFLNLHSTKQWEIIVASVKKNFDDKQKKLNLSLINCLDSILHDDQNLRLETRNKHFTDKEANAINKRIKNCDSINLIKVKKILNEHGWPTPQEIETKREIIPFLVIQHAPYKDQKLLLPQVLEASEKGYLNANWLATLEDRIAIEEGRPQTYGSQIGYDSLRHRSYILPLIDPENVDKRRKELGLNTIKNICS